MSAHVHPTAIVDDGARLSRDVHIGPFCVIGAVHVGELTVIKAGVELRDTTRIGKLCDIDSGVRMSGDCTIGDDVTIRYNAVIARGCIIGDGTYIAPGVVFNNLDHHKRPVGGAKVGLRCFIGTNATIGAGLRICSETVIGAGAVVTRDITEPGTYVGIPARRVK